MGQFNANSDDNVPGNIHPDHVITALETQLAEALKYGARENATALSYVKNPCTKHNQYWTTISGDCMACRAVDAEDKLAALEAELLRVRTTGHGAAHELDNIAVECGLGHSPKPGDVAAHVRQLRDAVRVLGTDARKQAEVAFEYSSGVATSYIHFVSDDVLNNPIARDAVEKV
jgi:hypothetical protein